MTVLGWSEPSQNGEFTNSFTDLTAGQRITNTFITEGADVIFPVAGGVGLGAAKAVQTANQSGGHVNMMWVDTDGCISAAQYCKYFITSIEKGITTAVKVAVLSAAHGTFKGGSYVGTLANGGAILAPYHDFASQVPASLQAELAQIKTEIENGTIKPADQEPDLNPDGRRDLAGAPRSPVRRSRRAVTRAHRHRPAGEGGPPCGWSCRASPSGSAPSWPMTTSTWSVEPGQIHALLGENGAGKTTLMNVLYGLMHPDEGQIVIDGQPAVFHSPGTRSAAGIGMVHQHFMLVPVFTVAENVTLGVERVRARGLGLLDRPRARAAMSASCRSATASTSTPTPTSRTFRSAPSSGWKSSRRCCAKPACSFSMSPPPC